MFLCTFVLLGLAPHYTVTLYLWDGFLYVAQIVHAASRKVTYCGSKVLPYTEVSVFRNIDIFNVLRSSYLPYRSL